MEYYRLVRKIAKSFEISTGLDHDDILQEAVYGYLKAMETFDPDRGSATTHVWHCVSNHLKNYVKQEENYYCRIEPLTSAWMEQVEYSGFKDNLSENAQLILSEIQRNQDQFLDMSLADLKKVLKKSLQDSGVNFQRFATGWKDLLLSLK